MIFNNNYFGNYSTMTFSNIYDEVSKFLEDYNNVGLPTTISDESATTLYYLLIAEYCNNSIANMDVNQFKYRLFSIIFKHGPTWEKELEIQSKLRELDINELREGGFSINNHSYNPSTDPSTNSLEELITIDNQNTSRYKRSKLDAYANLMVLLKRDVTSDFINKFRDLFIKVVRPETPLYYCSDAE